MFTTKFNNNLRENEELETNSNRPIPIWTSGKRGKSIQISSCKRHEE
jgi:ribosomal protein L39E